jgi:hypothetical protein
MCMAPNGGQNSSITQNAGWRRHGPAPAGRGGARDVLRRHTGRNRMAIRVLTQP